MKREPQKPSTKPRFVSPVGLGLFVLIIVPAAFGQSRDTVFVNVNLIRMDHERIEPKMTVIVSGGRIIEIGPATAVVAPTGATVIDGSRHYLLPGLTDAHVHLEGGPFWQGVREDFGDAPLYLTYGVTSVVNLRGTSRFFDWRRRVEAGELVGPNIYTAGEFIIGPGGPMIFGPSGELLIGANTETPEDIESRVAEQARQGVDVIKYYGGLSRGAYLKLTETARQVGIPLVGHSPDHLGLETWLRGGQALAHLHQLSNLYFFPPGALFVHIRILLATASSLLVIAVIGVCVVLARLGNRLRGRASQANPSTARELLILALTSSATFGLLVAGSYIDSTTQRLIVTGLAALTAIAAGLLLLRSRTAWRQMTAWRRSQSAASLLAAGVLVYTLITFWVPIVWRGADTDISRVARQIQEAGIPVQTTLLVWSNEAAGSARDSSAFQYLPSPIRERWRSMGVQTPGFAPSLLLFLKRVTAHLNRAGVQLVAGTDALGAPFVIPGFSLHQELALLNESGLTPYEALRTATMHPALFLRKEKEFGTIAVGKRADLLLVESNPLEDLERLKSPLGVMVRGRWLPKERLEALLAALK